MNTLNELEILSMATALLQSWGFMPFIYAGLIIASAMYVKDKFFD